MKSQRLDYGMEVFSNGNNTGIFIVNTSGCQYSGPPLHFDWTAEAYADLCFHLHSHWKRCEFDTAYQAH